MTIQTAWAPTILGVPAPQTRYRILTDGDWFHIQSKHANDAEWTGGISGTQDFLGLTDEECRRAYPMKKAA